MTHLRIYFSQMEHCYYSHKLTMRYLLCIPSSFGDIYPYFFWQGGIYFRFDFGQVFIIGMQFFLKLVFRIIYDFSEFDGL